VLAGTTSLLRLFATVSGSLVVLALVFLALSAPAVAAAPSPDPSPSAPAAHPDPYGVSPKPQAPARIFVPSAPSRTPVAATPVRTAPVARPKHRHRAAATPAGTVIRSHRPDSPASSIAEGLVSVADSGGRHISTGLALIVALLVLLSGALVAGAAREVAR
jgi:hypothetical protein